jgi:hypothetical protein
MPRPKARWSDAVTVLEHFALVTFDVDPAALKTVLPAPLEPDVRRLDDGRDRAFVSAVSFRDVDFRFRGAEAVRRSFFQTNYRAYVTGSGGARGVFFFETTLDSRLAVIPRRLWGMPWYGGRTVIDATWETDRCAAYRHVCTGERNACSVELIGSDDPVRRLDGFSDREDGRLLTDPLDGWFLRPDGRLGHYSVWHDSLAPTVGSATSARYAVFERLGLVGPAPQPHSVLLQRSVEFDVHLPPGLIASPQAAAKR